MGKLNGMLRSRITIAQKRYLRSRLIFLYHKGYLPKEIDHINRDSLDDRIENLRAYSHSLNCMNKSTINLSGAKYIFYVKKEDAYSFQIRKRYGNKRAQKWFKNFENAVLYRNKWLKKNDPHRFEELLKDKNENPVL